MATANLRNIAIHLVISFCNFLKINACFLVAAFVIVTLLKDDILLSITFA